MKVVSLGLDPKTLDPESVVAFRNRAYGKLVEHYSIVVPSPATVTVELSDHTTIYGVGGLHKVVKLVRMYRRMSKLIRSGMCDVITAQDMYYLGLLGLYFAWRHHLGLEVQVLGIEKLTWFRKRIAIFVLNRASIIRALSPRLRDRLIDEFGIAAERIRIVSIYVDVKKLGLEVRTLAESDMRLYEEAVTGFRTAYGQYFNFLTVSRLVPIKQITLQLEALCMILLDHGNVMLHIAGSGPDEGRLRREVARLHLQNHVVFHGYRSGYELGLLYLECDAFLLTSDYEGWGMVIIEAASAGLPIIMTDVGCAGELIIHEESGLVIPPRDVGALTDAMKRLIEDSALREKLSVGATHALAGLPSFDTLLTEYRQNWELAFKKPL
jgi:glycosyltransferase involved in cell wall biosynthesis